MNFLVVIIDIFLKEKIEFLYKFFPFRIRILIGQIINIIPEKMIHAFELLINKFLIKNQNYNQMYEKLKKNSQFYL